MTQLQLPSVNFSHGVNVAKISRNWPRLDIFTHKNYDICTIFAIRNARCALYELSS